MSLLETVRHFRILSLVRFIPYLLDHFIVCSIAFCVSLSRVWERKRRKKRGSVPQKVRQRQNRLHPRKGVKATRKVLRKEENLEKLQAKDPRLVARKGENHPRLLRRWTLLVERSRRVQPRPLLPREDHLAELANLRARKLGPPRSQKVLRYEHTAKPTTAF